MVEKGCWLRKTPSSAVRSGVYGTYEVRKLHRRWLRANAWFLTWNFGSITLMLGLSLLLLPAWLRGFMAGAYTATLIASVGYMMMLSTGTASRLAGVNAEARMADDLRSLEKHGWTLANHFLLEKNSGDVDHVLIGSAGLVTVETKWSQSWHPDAPWCNKIARDASWRTERVSRKIAQRKLPTHCVVAVFGPAEQLIDETAHPTAEATILPGSRVVSHVLSLRASKSDAAHLETARKNLDRYIAVRDKGERASEPVVRALWSPIVDVIIAVHVALAEFVIVGSAIRLAPEGVWSALITGVGLIGSLVLRRRYALGDRVRACVVAVAVMSGSLLVVLGVGGLASLL
jgi:Nuclease-related domain